jgi:hypothetical protein
VRGPAVRGHTKPVVERRGCGIAGDVAGRADDRVRVRLHVDLPGLHRLGVAGVVDREELERGRWFIVNGNVNFGLDAVGVDPSVVY